MVLDDSLAPDITEGLPLPLTRGGQLASNQFPADERFDVAFNGLGFTLRASEQTPYQRASEQVRKQQIDTSDDAGEQSLGSWWVRSQASWHMGSGIRWYEPGAETVTAYRFANSQGVDVWTAGEVKLLRKADPVASALSASTTLATLRRGGVDGYVVASGSALSWRNATGVVISASLPSSASTQPAMSGGVAWVGHGTGVSRWDTAGAGTLTTPLTGAAARVWWVKSRLVVSQGAKLYELAPTATGAITAGTVIVEHPDPAWVWTDVAETADAILACGYASSESTVYAFSLVDGTPLPTLGGARQVAKFPPGEQVMCLGAYLGAYVVLGTTRGIHVGVIGQDGAVQYGPLVVETTAPVTDVTFADRFAYASVTGDLPDGSSGVVRVDLSSPVEDTGLYAWAWDISTGSTATASSVCLLGNTDQVVVAAGGVLVQQHASELVPRGWVESGRIRYRTTELKNFQYTQVTGVLHDGQVELTAVDLAGVEHRVVTYGPTTGIDGEAGISIPGQPRLSSLALRMWLTPSAEGVSPVVTGLSLKALPSVRRARLVAFPLLCEDFETLRQGGRIGYEGAALHRVLELEALESRAEPVQVRDRRTGEAYTASIESVEFSGVQNPDRELSNVGGVVTVTVRLL